MEEKLLASWHHLISSHRGTVNGRGLGQIESATPTELHTPTLILYTMHRNIPLTRAQQFLSVENLNVISAVSLTPTVVSVQWKHGNNIL